jgi:hypothetical protein
MLDAGVDETTAMTITGHKTNAMFRRYNIVSTERLHKTAGKVEQAATRQIAEFQAAQRLFNYSFDPCREDDNC